MNLGLSPVPPRAPAAIIIPQDVPVYKIGEGGFFGPDDTLHPEGTIIEYELEPNLEMTPMNELAVQEMKKFTTKLDTEGRKVAALTGKAFSSYHDAFEQSRELAQQEAKSFKVIGEKKEVPVLGGKVKVDAKIRKIEGAEGAVAPVKLTKPDAK